MKMYDLINGAFSIIIKLTKTQYAQISSRIGGAIVLLIVSILFAFL